VSGGRAEQRSSSSNAYLKIAHTCAALCEASAVPGGQNRANSNAHLEIVRTCAVSCEASAVSRGRAEQRSSSSNLLVPVLHCVRLWRCPEGRIEQTAILTLELFIPMLCRVRLQQCLGGGRTI
jgi:hypothetical protein